MQKLEFDFEKSAGKSFLIIGQYAAENIEAAAKNPGDRFILQDSPIKVEHIREFLRWINLRPAGKIKIALINVMGINAESANALLKTLEEPPAYAIIILATKEEQRTLPTILSRCQKIRLPIEENILMPENYLTPGEISSMSVKEKFAWAAKASEEKEFLDDILTLWQMEYRQKMLQGEDCLEVLAELSRAKDLLMTNISVKLLLENLTLSL